MLCENCKKNVANTYFKQTVNGKTSEIFLCSECASKLGVNQTVTSNMDFGFGDLLNEFFSPYYQSKSLSGGTKKVERLTCSRCNMTEEEFFRTGKAGCENCYSTFKNRLNTFLNKLHGSKKHLGKTPASAGGKKKTSDIESLRKELAEAVNSENFEKAVVLRDKIKELEARNGD